MLVLGFLGTLLGFLLLEGFMRETRQARVGHHILADQILAYHLDWKAIQEPKLLLYLYVKKVNAVVRYQVLAGVTYDEAETAIEHLLAHPELLPMIPQKRRPALPEAKDSFLTMAIAEGKLDEAVQRYQALVDVDLFTARQVVERMAELFQDESLSSETSTGRLLIE